MADLLFEIGLEEMPARFVQPALEDLANLARRDLTREGLLDSTAPADAVAGYATPRRVAVAVKGLLDRQPDRMELVLGPPVKNAFDAAGKPTKGAIGFAKSQGLAVEQLEVIPTDKGDRVGFEKKLPGRAAQVVLAELLPRWVESLNFPKSMRWGEEKLRFARPIHWFVALYDGRVIPFELAGIKSGDTSRGHRFNSPGPVKLTGPGDYLAALEKASVIADRQTRRELTRREVEKAAAGSGGRLVPDPGLLEENTDLVEQAVACCGTFDPEFLEVPRPVIISAMREHQRYFALEDAAGRLLPAFVAVNNTRPKDLAVVTEGHQRVLRARLADARFFLTEDTRRPLINRLEDLKQVTYHAKLGTSFEKVTRFTALAEYLASQVAPELRTTVGRAAQLAKCDLVTEMVGEFPSLQGVVGEEYARRDGEDPEVARAVTEHYMPVSAEAPLPAGLVGTLVGLGDRLDTITGCFGVGLIPSGAADPYGLRRAAIAMVRLVTEKGLRLSLEAALDQALTGLAPWLDRPAAEVKAEVLKFFAARDQGLLAEQGVPTDVAQAVLAVGLDDLTATRDRALALAEVKDSPEFAPLAVGLKRVMNILKKEAHQVPDRRPADADLREAEEKELFQAFLALESEAEARFAAGDYRGFLSGLSALKGPIDAFFDKVLVMDPDPAVRANRLALLNQIAGLFGRLAEFTYLQLV
ncbi:MAG: glycine--tRNA ligase subunit beta [Deltaproteobacteria bacterium]|nr:glycine--tRNA ligase subunit beta [Deltaproteobacteria bacterium]